MSKYLVEGSRFNYSNELSLNTKNSVMDYFLLHSEQKIEVSGT